MHEHAPISSISEDVAPQSGIDRLNISLWLLVDLHAIRSGRQAFDFQVSAYGSKRLTYKLLVVVSEYSFWHVEEDATVVLWNLHYMRRNPLSDE